MKRLYRGGSLAWKRDSTCPPSMFGEALIKYGEIFASLRRVILSSVVVEPLTV